VTTSLADRLGGGSGMFARQTAQDAPVAPPAPALPKGRRPNAYAGACAKCGERVEAGAGLLGDKVDGRWTVEHVECPAAQQELPIEQPVERTAPAPAADVRVGVELHEGIYTVTFADGSYRTLKVEKQDDTASFMPGAIIVAYLSGSDNEGDYTSYGHVNDRGYFKVWKKHQGNEALVEAVRVLVGDPKAAMLAYAQHSGRCGRCNRTLTTPESIAAGVGPECAKKLGW
jgi:hypothetical protein